MARSFETDDAHSHQHLRPLRVATRAESIYEEAKTLVDDLPEWRLLSADDAKHVLTCIRAGGIFSTEATVTIRVEGPEGIPSCVVHVRSESNGGLLGRDRSNVAEFMRPLHRRVC